MTFSGLRRWVGLGALASATLLGAACGPILDSGGERMNKPPQNFFGQFRASPDEIRATQNSTNRGYNGTIKDLGSSIDPRTPEKDGTPGRSLPEDLAWRRMGQGGDQAMGGSGPGGTLGEQQPSQENLEPMTGPNQYLNRLQRGEGAGPGGTAQGGGRQ